MTMFEILDYTGDVLKSKGIRWSDVGYVKMAELQRYFQDKKHLNNAKYLVRKYIEKHF